MRAFQSAQTKGADIPEIICFERQSDWGGLWNYTWRTGLDEYGEPVHGSMYRYLWSNGPKECLEFADYTFNMFDAQAWYVRDVILGRIQLPDLTAMQSHSAAWRAREELLSDAREQIYFQGDYVKELMKATDYPSFDVDAVSELFVLWKHHKHEDIMGYRNHTYPSVMTGTQQPAHHTPWAEAMDDSLESYLS